MTKILALVFGLVGLLLACIGFMALSPGSDGYLRLVGGMAAAGAVVLLFFALRFYFHKPGERNEVPGWAIARRVILLSIGLYALGVPLYAVLVSGRIPVMSIDSHRIIHLGAEPQSFWLMVGLYLVPGLYALFLGLRR